MEIILQNRGIVVNLQQVHESSFCRQLHRRIAILNTLHQRRHQLAKQINLRVLAHLTEERDGNNRFIANDGVGMVTALAEFGDEVI